MTPNEHFIFPLGVLRIEKNATMTKYLSLWEGSPVLWLCEEVLGSKVTSYLLEKSRVTHAAANERTYHIFYQLVTFRAGSEFR